MASREFLEVDLIALGTQHVTQSPVGGQYSVAAAREGNLLTAGIQIEAKRQPWGGGELSGDPVRLGIRY